MFLHARVIAITFIKVGILLILRFRHHLSANLEHVLGPH
jgi:hypothetical protein